jgi:hypothetical protein
MNNEYWLGPYDVRVPLEVDSVVASDGGNRRYKNGSQTEKFVQPKMTKEEYLQSYAILHDDGYYYWKISKKPDYWLGPYGVRVPLEVYSVVASDGGNTRYQNGGETEMWCGPDMSKEEYLQTYATLRDDGHYYWKMPKKPDYWLGPYDVRVPLEVKSVVAADGSNRRYKNGTETEKFVKSKMSKEEYLETYTILDDDGHYYWKTPDYWLGPYDVRVPLEVDSVVASDGGNRYYKDGSQTEKFVKPRMTKKEYLQTYATLRDDGHYYWKMPKKPEYWLGPYDVRVPLEVKSVAAADGGNTRYQNGKETQMGWGADMSKEEYLAKYATLHDDGYYYWKMS